MLELTANGRPVALAPGTTVSLELNSPLFDGDVLKGEYSYSFTVPAAPNGEAYGHPELPESASVAAAGVPGALADDGQPLLRGVQRVRAANARRYTVNLVGQLAAALNGRKLASFAYGGERRVPLTGLGSATDLLQHATETVRNPQGYDYVFAPILNEGARGGNAPAAGQLVNAWIGLPGGGQFYDPGPDPLVCPLPWLRYVLASIFEEAGLRVDPGRFLPGELGTLLVGSSAALPLPLHRFRLADVLPDLTVVELLTKLRTALGVVFLVSAEGVVRSACYRDVLADPAYADLTHLASGAADVERPDPVGFTLTYSVDGDDQLTKALDLDFTGRRVGVPVAQLHQLPAGGAVALRPGYGYDVPQPELRLVTSLDTWYASAVAWAPGAGSCAITWTPVAPNFRPLDVLGGGEALEQGVAVTLMKPASATFGAHTVAMLVPAVQQPAFRAGATEGPGRSSALRLWFWRGLQPGFGDPDLTYPLATPYHRNARGARVGQSSLKLEGPDGTYERWLKGWLQVQAAPVVVKEALRLSTEQLAQHDPTRKVRVAGVDYLVRKLAPTVPLTRAVPVELVRA